MPHRYIDLKVPYGMTIQLHADGIYRFLLDENDLVKLRDWAADLTNHLTTETLVFLERRKTEEKNKTELRQLRVKKIPLDQTDAITATEKRITAEKFEPLAPTLPPEPISLMQLPPNRIVNTNRGKIEVGFDVTDKEVIELGYAIVPEPANPIPDFSGDNSETN